MERNIENTNVIMSWSSAEFTFFVKCFRGANNSTFTFISVSFYAVHASDKVITRKRLLINVCVYTSMYTAKFFSDVCLFVTGVKLQHLKTTLISKSNDENMDLFRASKVTDLKGLSFFS